LRFLGAGREKRKRYKYKNVGFVVEKAEERLKGKWTERKVAYLLSEKRKKKGEGDEKQVNHL